MTALLEHLLAIALANGAGALAVLLLDAAARALP